MGIKLLLATLLADPFSVQVLALHNEQRYEVGLRPLVWDEGLSVAAKQYAVELAATDKWEHSSPRSRNYAGENLWAGTRGKFTFERMIFRWSDEKKLFRPGTFPDIARFGSWHEIGHYTQMVWPSTKRVGCAIATNKKDDYLVCRYYPAGNVYGSPLLIQPTKGN